MKTFNIWMYIDSRKSPTGPWQYIAAIKAEDAESALQTARSRYGLSRQYQVYEGI